MQHRLGRALLRSETVHHKDGNRANNDPGNLELKIGAHSRGINILDGVLAWVANLERYAGLDLYERAVLAGIREKAERGLLGGVAPPIRKHIHARRGETAACLMGD